MQSHELAKLLLEHPDMPVLAFASNHHSRSYDRVNVGVTDRGEVIFGNFWNKDHHLNGGLVIAECWTQPDMPNR